MFSFVSPDIDDWLGHACSNGATCVDDVAKYDCICLNGYSGYKCQTSK